MKKQGFGKDDIQPSSSTEPEIVIDTEKADAIVQEVLIGVAIQISEQAGLPTDHKDEKDLTDDEFLTDLLLGLAGVGVELELEPIEQEDGKPLMDVKVKQTVGTIDLSDAVTKKEDK